MKKFLRHRNLLFSTLSEITSLIIAGHDKRIIFEKLLECAITRGPSDISVRVVEQSRVVREWMIKEGDDGNSLLRGRELAFDLPMLTSRYIDDTDTNPVIISAPLVAKESMFGLLIAIHRDDGSMYAPDDLQLITILANHAAIAVENTILYQKLEREAITDALTNVYNYRFLISSLETEIKRARRFKQSFSFVMLDVDNLKAYNDRLGHLRGSQALKEIAGLIQEHSREIDLVSKYGGDEFGILLPQTRLADASKVTRQVVSAVARHRFDKNKTGLLTCSAGVAMFPRDGQTVHEIIAAADKALYQAKRSGKNVVLTTEELIAEPA